MSENQSRSASDDLYDHEREESRSGRRRRPVADWGVGEDMFEHMPRNRFSRAAEGPPRERRFSARAADADRHGGDREAGRHRGDALASGASPADFDASDELRARREARRRRDEDLSTRDDSQRAVPEEPRRWTGPNRDEDEIPVDDAPPRPRLRGTAAPAEDVPRGGVDDGRRTIVIGKPEDLPSEIAAITADRDIGDDTPPEEEVAPRERRTVRIGGRPEGSLEAARYHRDHSRRRPAPRPHERLGARPDRIAMWAFALGLLLILIAILSAH